MEFNPNFTYKYYIGFALSFLVISSKICVWYSINMSHNCPVIAVGSF
jgi:hypothetical protein